MIDLSKITLKKSGETARFNDCFSVRVKKRLQNEDSGISTCEVEVSMPTYCPNELYYSINSPKLSKVFKGRTRLHEGDKFDALKGQDIAEHKAMAKAYNYMYTEFNKAFEYYSGIATSLLAFSRVAIEKRNKQLNCAEKQGHIL